MRGSWVRVPSLALLKVTGAWGLGRRDCLPRHQAQVPSLYPMTTTPHDPYAALRHGDFRWYVLSVMAMTIATQIRGVVVAWQLYALTHDPLVLGLIGLAEALPFIATALFAGHVADRTDRRAIALAAEVALWGCTGALLWLSLQHDLGRGDIPFFYLVIGVSGVARSFLMPARTAL